MGKGHLARFFYARNLRDIAALAAICFAGEGDFSQVAAPLNGFAVWITGSDLCSGAQGKARQVT